MVAHGEGDSMPPAHAAYASNDSHAAAHDCVPLASVHFLPGRIDAHIDAAPLTREPALVTPATA